MKEINRKSQSGFTIIEVMIVLAIAGLIMLIVFMAVPALQRNSRNTQRKNDVSALLSAMSEFQSNNTGTLPGTWDTTAGEFRKTTTSTTGTAAKLGIYAPSDVNYNSNSNAAIGDAKVLGTVYIRGGAKCGPNGDDFAGTNPSSRSVAAVYGVEQAGSPSYICQES